jgi:hypothetical protein
MSRGPRCTSWLNTQRALGHETHRRAGSAPRSYLPVPRDQLRVHPMSRCPVSIGTKSGSEADRRNPLNEVAFTRRRTWYVPLIHLPDGSRISGLPVSMPVNC